MLEIITQTRTILIISEVSGIKIELRLAGVITCDPRSIRRCETNNKAAGRAYLWNEFEGIM